MLLILKLHSAMQHLGLVWFMVFNVTFNNISVISWRSILLVEETGVHGLDVNKLSDYRFNEEFSLLCNLKS
jgi:hypothetical protein